MRASILTEKGIGGGFPLFDAMEALRRKHPDTYYHCIRVSLLADKFSNKLGMDKAEARDLVRSCLMHDIGKLLIDNSLLDQEPDRQESYAIGLQRNPDIGVKILEPVMNLRVISTVRHQYEYWDGSGTPDGLAGERIPRHARICAIADVFDSWVMPGSRAPNRSAAGGVQKLRRLAGSRLDPGLVESFVDMMRKPGAMYMYGWPGQKSADMEDV